MFLMAVGHSDDPETSEALVELLEQCQEQLQGKIPQAGILFAAPEFDYQQLLDGLLEIYPDLQLVGCSSSGEISSVMGYQQDSIILNLFYSDEVTFRAGVGRNLSDNPTEITQKTFSDLRDSFDHEPSLCLIFPEAVKGVYCEVVDAMTAVAGDMPVLGGVAGGEADIIQTYQFYRNEVLSDAVPMLFMDGNLKVSHGYASGWNPLGKTGVITQAKDNVIYEIDHQPALNFYDHYFSTFSPDNAYPLAIFPPGEEDYLIRASVDHDPEKGHLIVGGYVPDNAKVRITAAEQEEIIEATQTSFANAVRDYPGESPDAALFFTCAWRAWVLGTQTHQEFDGLWTNPNSQLPCAGFYTFGEIAPLRPGGPAFSHNTTFVTLLIGTR